MAHQKSADYSIGKTGNVDLRLLGVFIAVVDAGGLSQAQEPLNLALSSISTSLGDLENKLGMKLCNRGRGGFSLTENGQEVYRQAVELFAAFNRFNQQMASLQGRLSGELRIGILDNSTMSPSTRVPQVIHHFSERHPQVHIAIKVLNSDEIEQEIREGSLDLGIGLYAQPQQSLRTLLKFPVDIDLYCGSASSLFEKPSIEPDDVKQMGYAKGCYSPAPNNPLVTQLPVASASSYLSEGLAFLILSGRYIGFLPRRYSANWVSNGEMRALPESYSHQLEISLVVRRGERVGPILTAFLQSFEAFSDGA